MDMDSSRPFDSVVVSHVGSSGRIEDIAYDCGKLKMATCSDDATLSVWHRLGRQEDWQLAAQWEANASLTKVTWAHTEFGSVLAVGALDGEVSILEDTYSPWEKRSSLASPVRALQQKGRVSSRGSVTALEFAPRQHGLQLAVASTTGVKLYKPSLDDQEAWALDSVIESEACAALAWQPYTPNLPPMLLVGATANAKVWMQTEFMHWRPMAVLPGNEAVSAVAWANPMGRSHELVAIASHQTVTVFSLAGRADQLQIDVQAKLQHPAPVAQVGWNPFGNWLAASTVDSLVLLWRLDLTGQWTLVNRIVGTPPAPAADMEG